MQIGAKFTQLCDKRYFYGNVNELIMEKYGIFLNTGEFYTMR